jgi:hypothetical protein
MLQLWRWCGVTARQIIRRYAEMLSRESARWRTGDWRAEPRASLVHEVEGAIRRWLSSLPEDKRGQALQRMHEAAEEVTTTEADMDSVTLFIDWSGRRSSGRKPTCPCRPLPECPLLGKEIGWDPDQDPADRATPEELAQCPMQGRGELVLRVVAPKGDVRKRWQTKQQPAAGLVRHRDPRGRGYHVVGLVSGRTVPQMMRQARRMLYNWRKARHVDGAQQAEVVLLPPSVLDRLGRTR